MSVEKLTTNDIIMTAKKKQSEKVVRVFWTVTPEHKKLVKKEAKEQKYLSESEFIRDLLDFKFKL